MKDKDPSFPMESSAEAARSSSSAALTTTLSNSIQALGRGFDVTSDIRLLYCKGAPGSRLVILEEDQGKDLVFSDGVVVPNVPIDVECAPGKKSIDRIHVCSFHEVNFYPISVDGFLFFVSLDLNSVICFGCFWIFRSFSSVLDLLGIELSWLWSG